MKNQAVEPVIIPGCRKDAQVSTSESLSRKHDVTPAEVKALPTFQHYSDEQVAGLIEVIKMFTQIAYDMFNEQQRVEGGKVFNLSDNSPKQNVA